MRHRLLLLFALLAGAPSPAATDPDTLHFAAHFGLSYALEMTAYGLASRTLHFDRPHSLIASAGAVFLIGATRQLIAAAGGPVNTRGLWQNALGIGVAAGTVWVFDF